MRADSKLRRGRCKHTLMKSQIFQPLMLWSGKRASGFRFFQYCAMFHIVMSAQIAVVQKGASQTSALTAVLICGSLNLRGCCKWRTFFLAARAWIGKRRRTFLINWTPSSGLRWIPARLLKTQSVSGSILWRTTGWCSRGGGERVFCNPPYGRGVVRWFQKAWKEIVVPGTVVVMLVHARTDTVWWQGYVQGRAEVRFIPGRLHFGGKDRAPFPSAVVIYRAPGVIPGREWR